MKTATYRIVISILNLVAVFFLTARIEIAVGFTLLNILYTSVAYFIHERIWAQVPWGEAGPP